LPGYVRFRALDQGLNTGMLGKVLTRKGCAFLAGAAFWGLSPALAAPAQELSLADINSLSIEQLANVEITSVSKSAQPLSDAAASVYVISHDDIIRSGATTLPEILRLAPNLQVAQISADSYAITARGFNGNAADKLLVLIDGRSVYTPLFGGVLWDEKDVLPEDIERIEVISGPGATLWGANAVNGVINIITKKAADTQGGVLDVGGGNREARGSLQYGGTLSDDLDYRVYGETSSLAHDRVSTGANAEDGMDKTQGGFRLDWTPGADTLTLQGDIYDGAENATPSLNTNIYGGNIQASWQHTLEDGSSLQVLSYYDATRRFAGAAGGYAFNTYDLEVQHDFSLNAANDIVWGVGGRIYQDLFKMNGAVQFLPPSRTTNLADIFAQDTISLTSSVKLVAGIKLEADPFSGLEPLPNLRLSWKVNDKTLLWAAASRAVRAPTRFDVDLQDALAPGIVNLTGDRNFEPETVTAYEIGAKMQPTSATAFSVSAFYNVYDNLRSVEIVQEATLPFLWTWGNLMKADGYGVEAWASYGATDWWRLKASLLLQHQDRSFKPLSSGLGGVSSAGDDPNHQVGLQSSMDLSDAITWDADVRWVGMLPDPKVPEYVELNTRLGWRVSDTLEIAVSGFNLLHAHHLEYEQAGATTGDEVDRSVFVETRLHF
jgi:iron complex outermembrane receptor protein